MLCGAVGQINLEPAPMNSILEELEEWTRYIEAEPAVSQKLRDFKKSAEGVDSKHEKPLKRRFPAGPTL